MSYKSTIYTHYHFKINFSELFNKIMEYLCEIFQYFLSLFLCYIHLI